MERNEIIRECADALTVNNYEGAGAFLMRHFGVGEESPTPVPSEDEEEEVEGEPDLFSDE